MKGRPLIRRNALTFSREMAQLKRLFHAIKLDDSLDEDDASRAREDIVKAYKSIKKLRDAASQNGPRDDFDD